MYCKSNSAARNPKVKDSFRFHKPLPSQRRVTAGPTACLIALTRSASAAAPFVPTPLPTFIFMHRNPCSTKETASRAAVSGVSVSGFEPINALLSTKMSVSSGDAEAKELEVLPEVLEEDPVVSLELPEESRLAAPRSNDDARFLWPFLCVELDSACNTADSTAKRTLGSKLCTSRIPHSQTNQSRNAPLSKGRFGEIFTSRKSPETTASCAPASSWDS
mmetsp:Transcript_1506/g.5137  ORF Transcript_1506/g.5137 Transcript_1506/m.5137 type:complete len:219 (-) Transcript_1506:1724-2380(-)